MNNADKPINPLKRANNAFYDEKDESFINRIKPLIGLTKREYFAGLAMQAMISNPNIIRPKEIDEDFIRFSDRAIRYADELLKQLENE